MPIPVPIAPLGPAPEDEALWKALRGGDSEALRALMRRYTGTLHNYGGKFSPDDAFIEDCIQELFIDLWQHRDRLTALPQSVKAYLLTSLRRRLLRQRMPFAALLDEERYDFTVTCSPELIFLEDEAMCRRVQVVTRMLEELPRRQREILYLKYYQNLDRDQIAQVMGISHQSVSNLLQKALHALRAHLPADVLWLLVLCFS